MAGLKFGARAKGKNGEWVRWTPPWVDRRAKGLSVRSYASNEVHGRPGLGFARLFFCARPTQGRELGDSFRLGESCRSLRPFRTRIEMPKEYLSKLDFLRSFSAVPAIVDGSCALFQDRLLVRVALPNRSRLLRGLHGIYWRSSG
jgi:hypothetical protein